MASMNEDTDDRADNPLHLDRFIPYRLSVLSNTVSMIIAGAYEREFGLSIPQWRVIAVLARYPDLSAVEVAERTAMDKVAVSRAVQGLLDFETGFARLRQGRSSPLDPPTVRRWTSGVPARRAAGAALRTGIAQRVERQRSARPGSTAGSAAGEGAVHASGARDLSRQERVAMAIIRAVQ